ncbi:hypothetical protein [uncultured Victivallis sp.]|uniref:hypothetical protein n=1 Tax=uncultured Victivallis sp. TaxID=354118 RepID=UPI0025E7E11B|nr:hypothetical protein [uncultured Victivallis sp.]
MRAALIVVNVLLAVWLLAVVASRLTGDGDVEEFSVKKSGSKKNVPAASAAAPKSTTLLSLDSRMATIIDNNIFNSDRCPNAMFGRGRSTRIELTLVGTFEIDGVKGAIIKQKAGSSNNRGGFMGGPGGPGGRWGGRNNSSNSNTRSPIRVQFVDGVWRNFGGTDAATLQQQQQREQTLTLRQYVRVGETLSNGYTLEEVSRTGAVLTRGSDRMELEIQDPSLGIATASGTTQRRPNFFQQMQQMQQMQMRQNFQMMRMMQRTLQQNQNRGNTGNRGGAAPPPPPPPGR